MKETYFHNYMCPRKECEFIMDKNSNVTKEIEDTLKMLDELEKKLKEACSNGK